MYDIDNGGCQGPPKMADLGVGRLLELDKVDAIGLNHSCS